MAIESKTVSRLVRIFTAGGRWSKCPWLAITSLKRSKHAKRDVKFSMVSKPFFIINHSFSSVSFFLPDIDFNDRDVVEKLGKSVSALSPASPCKEAVCLPWCVFDDREGVQQSCQDHFPWEIFTSTQNQPHIFLSLLTLLTNWAEVYAQNDISKQIAEIMCIVRRSVLFVHLSEET